MNREQFVFFLKTYIEQHFHSQKAFADLYGISESYVSDVLSGRREPGEKILKAVGYQQAVLYFPRSID